MATKTKNHPGTILELLVNPYSKKVATRDNTPERQHNYAQLRTAMKHLMPENERLKAEIKRLKQENSILQKRLQAFAEIAKDIDLDAFQEWQRQRAAVQSS